MGYFLAALLIFLGFGLGFLTALWYIGHRRVQTKSFTTEYLVGLEKSLAKKMLNGDF